MKRILLAYDGSDGARRALEALLAVHQPGDVVTILASSEGTPLLGHAGTLPSPHEEAERRRQTLEARDALARHGIEASVTERHGDAAAAILAEADAEGVDLIVLGTRGLGTVERWLVGSVSTKVVQHARCSVLVAR